MFEEEIFVFGVLEKRETKERERGGGVGMRTLRKFRSKERESIVKHERRRMSRRFESETLTFSTQTLNSLSPNKA